MMGLKDSEIRLALTEAQLEIIKVQRDIAAKTIRKIRQEVSNKSEDWKKANKAIVVDITKAYTKMLKSELKLRKLEDRK